MNIESSSGDKPAVKGEDIQVMAFSVVGVLVLDGAMPELFQLVSGLILQRWLQYQPFSETVSVYTIFRAIALAVRLIMASGCCWEPVDWPASSKHCGKPA